MDIKRCCGTCRFWQSPKDETFKEKLKTRYQNTTDPVCRHDGKLRSSDEGIGCFGYKQADPWDLEIRCYIL